MSTLVCAILNHLIQVHIIPIITPSVHSIATIPGGGHETDHPRLLADVSWQQQSSSLHVVVALSISSWSKIVGDGSAHVGEVHASFSLSGELGHSLHRLLPHVDRNHPRLVVVVWAGIRHQVENILWEMLCQSVLRRRKGSRRAGPGVGAGVVGTDVVLLGSGSPVRAERRDLVGVGAVAHDADLAVGQVSMAPGLIE